MSGKAKVFLLLPQYDHWLRMDAAKAAFVRATAGRAEVELLPVRSSLLARNCNLGWAEALDRAAKGEAEFFAILHCDVAPQDFWLDILLEELEKTAADIISVVLPLKDERGLTSTAIEEPGNTWTVHKRLSMAEIMALPETFTAADVGFPDRALLLNTGCMLVDLRSGKLCQPQSDGSLQVYFTVRDKVVRLDDHWQPLIEPEDWAFSRMAYAAGARLVATRRVRAMHWGEAPWPNLGLWGNC